MKSFECSPSTPWGIHQSLQAYECPRCGWEADGRQASAELPVAAEQLGWAVVVGRLAKAA